MTDDRTVRRTAECITGTSRSDLSSAQIISKYNSVSTAQGVYHLLGILLGRVAV